MDLLEFTNVLSLGSQEMKKAAVAAGHGVDSDCVCAHAAGQVHIYRDKDKGVPVAGISVQWQAVRLSLMFAVTGFNADFVALTLDDESSIRNRRELVTITMNKAGEILWKLTPYEIVGHEAYFGAEEVPDAFPIRSTVDDPTGDEPKADILELMQGKVAWPAKDVVAGINPDYVMTDEIYEAHMDVGVAQSLDAVPSAAGVNGFTLYGKEGTDRARILSKHLRDDLVAILPAHLPGAGHQVGWGSQWG